MPRSVLAVVLWFAVQSTAHACGNEPPLEELTLPQTDRELSDAYEVALESSASRELLEQAQLRAAAPQILTGQSTRITTPEPSSRFAARASPP